MAESEIDLVFSLRDRALADAREQGEAAGAAEEQARSSELAKAMRTVEASVSFNERMAAAGVQLSTNIDDRRGRPSSMWDLYAARKAAVDELWKQHPNLEVAMRTARRLPPLTTPYTSDPMAEALGYNDIDPMWQRPGPVIRGPR